MISSKEHKLLSPLELHSLINKGNRIYLIHVLGSEHYNLVHLPGAFNACVYEVTFIDQVKDICEDSDSPIVLYGSSSNSLDSVKAAEKIRQEGYSDINILAGGIEAWRNAGLPLEGKTVNEYIDPDTVLRIKTGNGKYIMDNEKSIIEWKGRNMNSFHTGSVKITNGEIVVRNGKFSGKVNIDMESLTNFDLEGDELQPILISHLKSDDFFLTKLFPNAAFEILDASPVETPFLSSPNFKVKGNLELRGAKLNQDFIATVTEITSTTISVEAHFDIDRTRWGVIYGSTRFFEHLGMHLVFDLISIQIKLVASL